MKTPEAPNDPNLKALLTTSQRTLNNENFEQQVMKKIHQHRCDHQDIFNTLKRSLLSFVLAVSSAVVLLVCLLLLDKAFGVNSVLMPVIGLFVVITMSLVMLDNYKRLITMTSTNW